MLIDSDDLHITASVVRAMADASKKGWQTLDSAASVLNEGWLGNRAEEFDDQYEALVSQAEKILKHLDEIPQKIINNVEAYLAQEQANTAGISGVNGQINT
ncbi:WXG100 family type VII secretion target [Mycobacteroides abscessus subsp. abscessus]|uniref:WXG100 family type VII secretion target n=1 Tax=Mycobacteroides abscessus TaxID=36809 RepID=UPI0006672795|nr:WXG100 family type VII secretion target [Mycobacteroides abscessus]AKP60327.1 hypothetical protein MAUC22_24255 [Mycobacteroides abscessus UC22]AWG49129.1 hypothetical protein DDT48_06760 [Mycobacteroides abscessus]MBN7548763.1 WXG100 family type VII secretion target [Mycobacteroides abscessus subsp. abscessus]MDM2171184.1 WXG100 family type VII secretion target [Mycobacteroides abscessus]MDM2177884.1 WXG100 family type VII secretion target [Mycobacteroides abscessus]